MITCSRPRTVGFSRVGRRAERHDPSALTGLPSDTEGCMVPSNSGGRPMPPAPDLDLLKGTLDVLVLKTLS